MAISSLDERSGSYVLPRLPLPAAPRPPAPCSPTPQIPASLLLPRRPPPTVLGAALLAFTEAVGLVSVGLATLDRVIQAEPRPAVGQVALVLALFAGWVVLCAAGGVALLDGAGRLLISVCCGELVLLVVLVAGGGAPVLAGLSPGRLPLAALALCALAVPTGKLLLASSPAALRWVADTAARLRPAPDLTTGRERRVQAITLTVIGVVLTALAVLGR